MSILLNAFLFLFGVEFSFESFSPLLLITFFFFGFGCPSDFSILFVCFFVSLLTLFDLRFLFGMLFDCEVFFFVLVIDDDSFFLLWSDDELDFEGKTGDLHEDEEDEHSDDNDDDDDDDDNDDTNDGRTDPFFKFFLIVLDFLLVLIVVQNS